MCEQKCVKLFDGQCGYPPKEGKPVPQPDIKKECTQSRVRFTPEKCTGCIAADICTSTKQ